MRFFHFMGEGGWAMWFVLALALITVLAAVGFARRPGSARKEAVCSFSRATSLVIVSAVSLNLAAVGSKIPNNPEWANSPRMPLMVMEGISESLAPAILGFTLLSLAWLVMAIGQRRLSHELSSD
ncbi:MAG: hypothetical protein ABI895_34445 [Deltaproteobacteria bacterium]